MTTEEERKAKNATRVKAYRASPEGKKYKAKNAAYVKAWRASPQGIEYYKAHRASPEGKAKKAAYMKAHRASPEGKAKQEAYRASPEGKMTSVKSRLRRKYGITVHQRDEMILDQGNRCLCCKTLFGLLKAHKPNVDHCHRTGKVRGILCNRCNTLLGHAGDNPSILRACVRYLERHARSDRDEEASQATG